MPTLQGGSGPANRTEVGDSVIDAASTTDVTPVKKRFDAFAKAHRTYVGAARRADAAEQKLRNQQAQVGKLDVTQDERVERLAVALVGDGLPRANPFKPLKFDAPSTIVALGYGEEAKVVHDLAAAVTRWTGASKTTLAAAKAADSAATEVEKAIEPIEGLERAWRAEITKRDALGQPWETAFAALKSGARSAEHDGAKGLFSTLFERTGPRVKRPKKGDGNG